MSTTQTERQIEAVIQAAAARRCTTVPHAWVVARLLVVVDARVPGILEAAASAASQRLAIEVEDARITRVFASTHGHEHAAMVLQEMRQQHAAEARADQPLLSLRHDDALAAAAEHLAEHPHGALLVTTVLTNGHALAARWS